MDRIFDDGEQVDDLQMIIYRGTDKNISGPALIGSLGLATSVGDNAQVSISFVISGKSSRKL